MHRLAAALGAIAFVGATPPTALRAVISIVGPDGSGLRALASGEQIAWSPDGTRLAFLDAGSGARRHAWLVNADGSGLRDIGPSDEPVAWSPAGTQVVVKNDAGLAVEMLANGRVRQLTHQDPNALYGDHDPEWSHDGRWIAFLSERQGALYPELDAVRTNGTGLHRVAANVVDPPSWSVQSRLLFSSAGLGRSIPSPYPGVPRWKLYVARVLGKPAAILARTTSAAVWSPDGRWIAFAALESSERLEIVRPNGTNERTVFSGGGFLKSWAPDSRHLAVVGRHGRGLFVVDLTGHATTVVDPTPTSDPLEIRQVVWQPRSKR